MAMTTGVGISGRITTALRFPGEASSFGRVSQPNMLMDDGVRRIAHWIFVDNYDFMCDDPSPEWARYTYIQVGTGARDGGRVTTVLPNRVELYQFHDERPATVTATGGTVRHSAQFPIPIDLAVNEAGIFNGSHHAHVADPDAVPAPNMLSQATFIDTVQRVQDHIRYLRSYGVAAPPPGTDTIYLTVTWDIGFSRALSDDLEFVMERLP